jgi:OOP family OmpA-OmpF porin
MRKLVLLAALVAATTTQVSMAREAFWSDSKGVVVKDGHGDCLRTQFWTADDGVCPSAPKAAPAPTPVAVMAAPAMAAPVSMPVSTKHTFNAGAMFAFDSAKLTPAAEQDMAKMAAEAKSLNTLSMVMVEGHTDNIGTAAYNQQLSIKRAMAVRTSLIAHGVPANLIEAKGYGFDKPIASNKSKDGRSQNRRVEIIINGTK